MATKRKRPPPGNIGAVDNQGGSELCVRFAIGKAVAHHLYLHEKIDIDQSHIMICLVQAIGSIAPVNPKKYNNIKIYVQDKENLKPKPSKCAKCDENEVGVPDKSWWELWLKIFHVMNHIHISVSYIISISIQ